MISGAGRDTQGMGQFPLRIKAETGSGERMCPGAD